jgi:hypothetical protein
MEESGIYRTPALEGWQRTNVVAAANSLREEMSRASGEMKPRGAYEGLLDLLDPSQPLARKQCDQVGAARPAAGAILSDRRARERRSPARRRADLALPNGQDRRRAARRATDCRTR